MPLAKIPVLLALIAVLQGCVAAAVVTVVGGATVVNDRRTIGNQIDDQTIEIAAYNALGKVTGLKDNTNIQVTSVNGTLLAVGQAPNAHLRDLAIKTLTSVNGVAQFHNQIRIGSTTSLLTRSNDVWLTSKVKTALFASDKIDATAIKVITENAEVFLMGLVNQTEADEAVNIARNISGVNRVYKAFEYL